MRHKTEAGNERWMDNGVHSGQMATACFDLNACCSLLRTEGKLEKQHFVLVC